MSEEHREKQGSAAAITIAAIGIVFGDIGTSPLYALRECFNPIHGYARSFDNIVGVVSLIIWILILVVCVKYVSIVLRADNKGEGGILSLVSLVSGGLKKKTGKAMGLITILGIIGAALLFSDGILTPSVSVLSALEGLELIAKDFEPFIVPIALVVLVILFLFQSRGTAKVGRLFGPVIAIWFATMGILGIVAIVQNPVILYAINPGYAVNFFLHNGVGGFAVLSSVILAVTGAEVLYTDLGHFGKRPIRLGWYFLIFPALVLNYAGQGAFLLGNPNQAENLFFQLAPGWTLYPVVIIATAATIIASQSIISGAFSLARQGVRLGFFPRMHVQHTSSETIGQIYVPFINWALMIGTILLVVTFKKSSGLANAYGIAVSADMLITTCLMTFVAIRLWGYKAFLVLPVSLVFFAIDISLFSANISKVVSGGWIVVAAAIALVIFMKTWLDGRATLQKSIEGTTMHIDAFVQAIGPDSPPRVKGTGIFLSGNPDGVPTALLHNLKHNKILHETTIILSVQTLDQPRVLPTNRAMVREKGNGLWHIVLYFGFTEQPDLPRTLEKILMKGLLFDPMQTTWFLGREALVISKRRKRMAYWRKRLFLFMSHNALGATNFFHLPPNRVVEIGARVEI